MFEIIKQRIIKNLIEEIECLSPTYLEIVGQNVLSFKENKRFIHHGINKDYKPSGYTVDSFTDDSKIIIEYSTDLKYFEDTSAKDAKIPFFEKIEKDIKHAIEHTAPQLPDKIYLITSQQEPPSFRGNFNKTLIAQEHAGRTTIYDNRELAKLIYEQSINSDEAASFYKQFFPGFSQDLDNYEYYGKAPSFCEKHITNDDAVKMIVEHFGKYNVCVLYGVSGSGKTQLAIDYLHTEKQNFENY
ncbi:MAG TPA: hypothetical protein VJ552_12820, partial [Sediminibacterium sp.]|nr:hypothetical protein [Sediminibacterium sp.]